jgi:hypothetical protein
VGHVSDTCPFRDTTTVRPDAGLSLRSQYIIVPVFSVMAGLALLHLNHDGQGIEKEQSFMDDGERIYCPPR